jgi:V/A-type H+-transporting ATPase subunit F
LRFFVIGDEDTVLGFRLAGIKGRVVKTPEESKAALEQAFQEEGLGVVIIPERIASPIRQHVDRFVYKTTFPLIIEIPDGQGPMEDRGSIRDLIRTAVGVHL